MYFADRGCVRTWRNLYRYATGKVHIYLHRKISAWYLNHQPIYYYFRFYVNKRPPNWNSTSGSDFYGCVIIGMSFGIYLPNFIQIGPAATELWRHIHFQDGGHGIAIVLPVSVFVISLIWEGRNLPVYQISARYLNPRLRYYYFQFLKTNVRHVGILLHSILITLYSTNGNTDVTNTPKVRHITSVMTMNAVPIIHDWFT